MRVGGRFQGRVCTARREGDPARIVAGEKGVTLGWQPRLDNLATIVAHALDWERELRAQRMDQDRALKIIDVISQEQAELTIMENTRAQTQGQN